MPRKIAHGVNQTFGQATACDGALSFIKMAFFLHWSRLCLSPRLDIFSQETGVTFRIHFNPIIYSEWTFNFIFHYTCPNHNASTFPGRKYLTSVKNKIQTIEEKGYLDARQCSITRRSLSKGLFDAMSNFQRPNYGIASLPTIFKLYLTLLVIS